MRKGILQKVLLVYGLSCLIGSAGVQATEYFVDGNCGSDSNSGLTNVCGGSDGPKLHIQNGIDAALAVGDLVTVMPGNYLITTAIVISRPITVSCLGFAGSCVIEGGSTLINLDDPIAQHGFSITGTNVAGNEMIDATKPQITISGFMIQDTRDAVVSILNASPTIQNCTLKYGGNVNADGGGINLTTNTQAETRAQILGCYIYSNTGRFGGGIYISGVGEPTIDGCSIAGNVSCSDGGGISIELFSVPMIKNCRITNNTTNMTALTCIRTLCLSPSALV